MAKLISVKEGRANKSISLAIVGEVKFNEDCTAEISDSLAENLSNHLYPHPTLGYYVDGYPTQLVSEEENEEGDLEEDLDDDNEGDEVSDPIIPDDAPSSSEVKIEEEVNEGPTDVDLLKDMNTAELREFAKTSGFPEEEWKDRKNPASLRKYLSEKLDD